MPVLQIFFRLFLRPLRREPLRTALTVVAVALGVAAVLAIELAGEAATGSFRSSLETLTGGSQIEVTATGGVPADVFTTLATLPYPLKLHPRIEDYVVLQAASQTPQTATREADSNKPRSERRRTIALLGVDLYGESFAADKSATTQATDTAPTDFRPNESVWLSSGLGRKVGDQITLLINDSTHEYTVRGVFDDRSGEVVVMDLAPANAALRRNGRLDRVLIDTPEGTDVDQWQRQIQNALPPGISVARQGTQTDENRKMLEAFRWNLRVLSYVSLAVGAFLIYNTISVSVVRRRFEIGILRALGATRGGILAAFLGEAACFGFLGGLAGIVLGRLMAVGAVQLVATTVQNLYVSSQPGAIALTWRTTALALAIGLGVALASAFGPALEASRVAPVDAMARGRREHQSKVHRWRDLAIAAVLAVIAWVASQQDAVNGKPVYGYLCALILIAASALTIPALVSSVASLTASTMRRVFGVEALLATRSLAGSLRRTSVLIGALSTAIAVLTAVGIMVGSFRETVQVWMDDILQADLYMSPAVPPGADRHPTMASDIPAKLAALPEVAAVDQLRAYEIRYQGAPATLGGMEAAVAAKFRRRPFVSGKQPAEVFRQLIGQQAVVVSEPFANKHHVHAGGTLTLDLGESRAAFRIVDVYYDYSSERGMVLMDRATLFRYLPDESPTNVAVYLKPGVALDDGQRAVETAVGDRKVAVAQNRFLREQAIIIFDRTFAITYALEAVAVFVAVVGVGGALLALVIDRRREFGLLRFLGAAENQVRRIILFEAGLLGILANIAGMILGFFLSLLLIYVINKQSFGWTIQFHWPVAVLLSALTIVYSATVLAGLYPARIATRLEPIEVIHEE